MPVTVYILEDGASIPQRWLLRFVAQYILSCETRGASDRGRMKKITNERIAAKNTLAVKLKSPSYVYTFFMQSTKLGP